MIEEKSLSLVYTVDNDDKVRVVTSEGLSLSIEVGHLKSSLSVDDLPDRVDILETKADTNEVDHTSISSRLDELETVVGEETVDGGTVTNSGLFEKISSIRSDLTTFHLEEVDRLDGELDVIRADLTLINGTNGQLEILTDSQTNLENLIDTKLDQSTFQNAVAAGFKIIGNTPASASAAGEPGEVRWDTEYFYVCVAANTWKRIPLQDW